MNIVCILGKWNFVTRMDRSMMQRLLSNAKCVSVACFTPSSLLYRAFLMFDFQLISQNFPILYFKLLTNGTDGPNLLHWIRLILMFFFNRLHLFALTSYCVAELLLHYVTSKKMRWKSVCFLFISSNAIVFPQMTKKLNKPEILKWVSRMKNPVKILRKSVWLFSIFSILGNSLKLWPMSCFVLSFKILNLI